MRAHFATIIGSLMLTGAGALLSACSSSEPAHMLTPFLDTDFGRWKGPGDASVTGQAFVKLASGRVVTCAGETVSLVPATGYNMEMEQALGQGLGMPDDYSKRAHAYDRKTTCDGVGRFSFENVPAMNWIVLTRVNWQEPSFYPFLGPNDKGGFLYQEKTLDDGANNVILTKDDFIKDAE